jgi:isopentenyldiphosphate isomerase/intracellular septation protein A
MSQKNVLLSFLPGFAPILLYIAVDSFFGETAGLVAGVALGLGEFFVILFKERRVDAFSLVDTVLLVAMGALSWALSDPVYFRLKPAVSGGVLALMMILGALGPHRLFLPYIERKSGFGPLPEAAIGRMTAMIAGFGFLTLAHSALTAVAALYWSKAAWNFVAGALFWILAFLYVSAWTVPAFVARFRARGVQAQTPGVAANLRGDSSSTSATSSVLEGAGETLPIVDASGTVVGKAPRPLCHSGGAKPLHPVVRLWLTDGAGMFWMQKRAMAKLVQPGRWDCAVGGHVSLGETLETALRREAREEIGLIDPGAVRLIGKFVWETAIERELVFTFIATLPLMVALAADPAEVDEIRHWSRAELAAALARGETNAGGETNILGETTINGEINSDELTALARYELALIPALKAL